MSTFAVAARRLEITPHPNADLLEVAQVDDYQAVVKKGEFVTGDLALYIPEQAIVPPAVLQEMELEGRLAGPQGNRVKAIRLRGLLSQGLVWRPLAIATLEEGRDYQDDLGISKWIPPVPLSLSGKALPCPSIEPYTEIENRKRFPNAFIASEDVVATEKLHGSCLVAHFNGHLHVSSKGLASQHLALVEDPDAARKNAYWQVARALDLEAKLRAYAAAHGAETVTLYGELLGVQDLMYGLQKGRLDARCFDLRVNGRFLDAAPLAAALQEMELTPVPTLLIGAYDTGLLAELAEGRETVTGTAAHVREGLVVRPVRERSDPELGRVILKFVSEAYLLRRGDTTEFE